jgi:hypothetical protein
MVNKVIVLQILNDGSKIPGVEFSKLEKNDILAHTLAFE